MESIFLTGIIIVLLITFLGIIFYLMKFIIGIFMTLKESYRWVIVHRFKRRCKYRHMLTYDLRQGLFNHGFFAGGLKDTKALERFFSLIRDKKEKQLIKELNESKLYSLLVDAEREIGLKGRPETIDYYQDIWDILLELSKRTN